MTQRLRQRLLYLLTFAFFIIGGSAALYAQGYRIDMADFSLEKIGGIYVRTFPSRASIYLDGELVERGFSLFQNGTLINDLIPHEYHIRLVAENYEEWNQTVEVLPALVTELKFAVLMPKVRTEVPETKGTKEFWIGEEGLIISNASSTLKMLDKNIPGSEVIDQDYDSNRILTSDSKKNIFVYDYRNNSSTSLSQIAKTSGIQISSSTKVELDSDNSDVVIYNQEKIYLLNIPTGRFAQIAGAISTSTASSSITFSEPAKARERIAWTEYNPSTNSSVLVVYDKNRRNRFLYEAPFPGKTTAIKWHGDKLSLLQNDGLLYYGVPSLGNVNRIAENVSKYLFTDNGVRVAVVGNGILELIPLRNFDEEEYIRFDMPDSSKISRLDWYKDNRHLFISYSDRTMFLDIDDAFLEHYYRAGSTNSKYDRSTNRLYYLESDGLVRIDLAE